jgi:hypothetical protein
VQGELEWVSDGDQAVILVQRAGLLGLLGLLVLQLLFWWTSLGMCHSMRVKKVQRSHPSGDVSMHVHMPLDTRILLIAVYNKYFIWTVYIISINTILLS